MDTTTTETIKCENSKHITRWKHSSEILRIKFDMSIIVERVKASMARFSWALTSVLTWDTGLEKMKDT